MYTVSTTGTQNRSASSLIASHSASARAVDANSRVDASENDSTTNMTIAMHQSMTSAAMRRPMTSVGSRVVARYAGGAVNTGSGYGAPLLGGVVPLHPRTDGRIPLDVGVAGGIPHRRADAGGALGLGCALAHRPLLG